jgi:site-specific recombinase XerD
VLRALRAVPRVTDSLYFWSGNGKLETAVKDYQGRLLEVFKLAGLSKGKTFAIAHRFRDTFAVHLLLAGVPIERVQILLGHSSVKTTQKHYSPWVKARQEQLEADLRSVWTRQEQGTKQVQKVRVISIR